MKFSEVFQISPLKIETPLKCIVCRRSVPYGKLVSPLTIPKKMSTSCPGLKLSQAKGLQKRALSTISTSQLWQGAMSGEARVATPLRRRRPRPSSVVALTLEMIQLPHSCGPRICAHTVVFNRRQRGDRRGREGIRERQTEVGRDREGRPIDSSEGERERGGKWEA